MKQEAPTCSRSRTCLSQSQVTARLAHGKQYIYDGLESGALSPIIDRTFPLDAIADAHRYMESNQQKGKIVVTV